MKLFITGINGFLGSRLGRFWASHGHTVIGSARRVGYSEPFKVVPFAFGQQFNPAMLEGAGIVVHCAHSFLKDGFDLNVAGTTGLYEATRRAGVRRQIFISSCSARPNAASNYGRIKFALEQFFLERGETVIRPGLVVGYGGLFGRTMDRVLNSPLTPLLDTGSDLLPVIGIDDFVSAMESIIERSEAGAYNLFNEDLIPLRTLLITLNSAARHHTIYINVRSRWAMVFLKGLERLNVPFPVTTDNIAGLKFGQDFVFESNLKSLIAGQSSLDAIVSAALAERASAGGPSGP